ncbi:hypothetical protein IGI04_015158 [Brassica rapa subsp. trilocularis]|uniref:Uncharacterized protein n=1 Tax=Brassica rapa subsp. trilocularis TaxID=1813537 RepID=A0ABQ7MSA6_BRACM|nr:hypothetical protein IGI04_015158 [Brassica rapa subsp. trilocularis]
MEAAQIDWKRIDSRFVEDVFYEHLRAPKWFDFLSPDNHLQDSVDDAWFCKPDCNHPKRPEDFLLTPNSSKVCASPSFSLLSCFLTTRTETTVSWLSVLKQTPGVTEQSQRRRGHALSEGSENQNPNLATPPPSQQGNKSWRAALKSTSVKKMSKETPKKLKSTQSARNLFSGRDILGHISEFCYELKRLATRGVTEREETTVKPQVKEVKERKPLLEVSKDKEKVHESTDAKGSSTFKESRQRKNRVDDAENIPVSLNVEVKMKGEECKRKKKPVVDAENIPPLKLGNVKNKGHERLLQQIRTNPPSPQCFSENRTASLKALMTKSAEKSRDIINKEGGSVRGLDVLWFLKPCTMAN